MARAEPSHRTLLSWALQDNPCRLLQPLCPPGCWKGLLGQTEGNLYVTGKPGPSQTWPHTCWDKDKHSPLWVARTMAEGSRGLTPYGMAASIRPGGPGGSG